MNKPLIIGVDWAKGRDRYVVTGRMSTREYAYCPATKNYELKHVRQSEAQLQELNRVTVESLVKAIERHF